MKKILLFAIMAMLTISVSAQQRKTWDFTAGVSDATIENMDADDNWTVSYNDDGSFYSATDATKMYGTLTANGVEIAELSQLTFTSTGLSSGSNFILRSSQFRMTRANSGVTFHVAPGQTITIRARSANSSAENRGFVGDENLTYVSGPSAYTTGDNGGVCLGNSVSGASPDSDGNYTLVWKVSEDIEDDSLDVTISCYPSGGLDIASFMIDEGDAVEEAGTHILYLYDSSYADYTFGEDDFIYFVLADACLAQLDDTDLTSVDIASNPTDLSADSLRYYDLVVLSSALSSSNEYVNTIAEAVAYVPILNTSTELYETWGWGKAVETGTGNLTIGNKAKSSSIWTNSFGESMINDGIVAFYTESTIIGYEPAEGSYIASDTVWATANGIDAIHLHKASRNAYMLFPIGFPYGDVLDDYADLMYNIVSMLLGTKTEVTQSGKPKVSEEYISTGTNVTLSCSTNGATIYYTLDGTDPTTESTIYSEPFFISEEGTVLKAFSTADGYDPSDVNEVTINIYELLPSPTISYDAQGDTTYVTIAGNSEEDVIYFNYTGSDATTSSEEYTEVIKLVRHNTISAFVAARGEYLQSELATLDIPVTNEKVRLDVVSHLNADKNIWTATGSNPTYYNTKSGHAYYSDEIIGEDAEGNTIYAPADSVLYYAPEGNDWEIYTYGQVIYWQSNGMTHNVGDGSGYNPERAIDDDTDGTSYCITFGAKGASNSDGVQGPAYTAAIQSTKAFQGPFDIVSNIAITGSSAVNVIAYVTTDTLSGEWTELGYLETGTVKRLWRHTILGYEGTDAVFVKLVGDNSAAVFDLYIKNAGELSEEYVNGIVEINAENKGAGELLSTAIYNINGVQQSALSRGINIIREVYSNGVVKVRKVAVK